MYKAIGIWSWPPDEHVEAFVAHYDAVHVGLATMLPGLLKVSVMQADGNGRDANIFRLAECYWSDAEAFTAASSSEEWARMAADAAYLATTYGVELTAAHGEEHVQ